MLKSAPSRAAARDPVLEVVRRYWGYDSLRPLQAEAIKAGLDHRDSLVVLPTGGGKSLCYQVPPVVAGRIDVVVSPLISLMKDQVDALRLCGYPAACLHSGLSSEERRAVEFGMLRRDLRLVFVSPERLLTPWFLALLQRLEVRAFAIDEAHCISQWGHDFRPEYCQLSDLRRHFPEASIHAYTATATPRVRADIIQQLRLRNPNVIVGTFDRPNLVYRVLERRDTVADVLEALRRHAGEAAIVYCISRKDTEGLTASLRLAGIKAAAYHAGLDATTRRRVQDEFAAEKIDVVVATVAFGMGIDRSNVRAVVHAAMPKSVEHYQQESGRAGRDGLEAECLLLYSPADVRRWEAVLRFGAKENGSSEEVLQSQLAHVREMASFSGSRSCRHAALSRYFGQEYPKASCGACDVCLGEAGDLKDESGLARTVLGAVKALREGFGVNHVVDFLVGANTEAIRRRRQQDLPEYGALRGRDRDAIKTAIYQMLDLGVLGRTPGDRPVLRLNAGSRAVLEGRQDVLLPDVTTAKRPTEKRAAPGDEGLFDALRRLRRRLADERQVPAFVVLSDATLRDIADVRPTSLGALMRVRGIAKRKLEEFGAAIVETVRAYLLEHRQAAPARPARPPERPRAPASGTKADAFAFFARGASLDEVAARTGRTRPTAAQYLADFVLQTRPASVSRWVPDEAYRRVEAAARRLGADYLKPVFDALEGEVSYEDIRVVVYHLRALGRLGRPDATLADAASAPEAAAAGDPTAPLDGVG